MQKRYWCSVICCSFLAGATGCGQTNGDKGGGSGGFGGAGATAGGRGGGNSLNGGGMSAQPPGFLGAPNGTPKPLTAGCGPETKNACSSACDASSSNPTVVRPPATLCFSGAEDPTPDDPTAIIEQVIEEQNGQRIVHLRVTFDPSFVDNTYGTEAIGWDKSAGTGGSGSGGANAMPAPMPGKMTDPMMPGMMKAGPGGKSGHTFDDLVGSDHVELLLTDGNGSTVMDFALDYISQASTTCGYDNLGVSGGEGKMITGSASSILAATSSLARNLNGCGYCYTENSPATDVDYTPNPEAPNWDYRVVYEVWISLDAFGNSGFGQAYINSVHASPSKLQNNTVNVLPTPCPPTWDTPYCPPGATDTNCKPTGDCPPNYELYVQTEGQSVCTPIPFSNYPDMAPCPAGYELDPATEGRYCVPVR